MGAPSGTVTFLFTDIEGSTRVHRELGGDFVALIATHDSLLSDKVIAHGGTVVKSLGDGLFVAFPDAAGAVRAAAEIQRAVVEHSWPHGVAIRVRIGMHTGEAEPKDGDYVALAVHQAARVAAAAYGGQILASTLTATAAGNMRSEGAWRELGAYRLKGFDDPVALVEFEPQGLPRGPGGVRAVPAAAHNVPEVRTTFVGRRRELAELSHLLDRGRRMITVLGPGGVGKTRLAFELLKGTATRYEDGAWVVLLANAAPDEVDVRTLHALGVPERTGLSSRELLVEALRDRHCLLLFDNCEQVVDAVAGLAQELLSQDAGLALAATSREPLRIADEVEWRLQPMSIGEPGDTDGDAVDLFVDRARARTPDLVLGEREHELVADICRRVDALPLAIELAAGRLRHMTLGDLASRLEDRLRVLTIGDRGMDPRHSTIYALVDWSYGLLSPAAQTLMARLSVFRGPVTFDDVGAVCAEPGGIDLDEALAELVDKSLVVFDYDAARPYRMLITIRDFARTKLESSGERLEMQGRHARWCTRLARRVAEGCDGPEAAHWLAEAEASHDDLDAAMAHLLEVGRGDLLAVLATDLFNYFAAVGRLSEARGWLERAADAAPPGALQARARSQAGQLACLQGDLTTAQVACEAGLREATACGDRDAVHAAEFRLGHVLAVSSDLEGAATLFRSASGATSPVARTNAINGLGAVSFYRGDLVAAEGHYREALAIAEEAGCVRLAANVRMNLGELLVARRRYDEAERLLADAADVQGLVRHNLPIAYEILSRLYEGRGQPTLASTYRERALQAAREIGDVKTQERLRGTRAGDTTAQAKS